ncbi:MAG: PEP-CTERM sorting domain-containing protein [Nitrospirota bacterium]
MKKLALCFILVLGIAASGCDGGVSGGSKSGSTTTGESAGESAGADLLDPVGNENNNGDSLVADIVGDEVPDIVADTVGDEVPDIVGDTVSDINNISDVPEPGSLILLGSGLIGLALHRLRRLKK